MSKTRAELIDQALIRLQILSYGQTASDQDVQKMDGLVDPATGKLAGLEIYYVADPGQPGPTGGDIDDAAFLPLADYLASYHLLADARMQALAIVAVGELRTLSAPARTHRTLRIDPALTTPRIGAYRGGFN